MFDKILDFLSDVRIYPSYWNVAWRKYYLITLPISGPIWVLFWLLRCLAVCAWMALYLLIHLFAFLTIRQILNIGAWAYYIWTDAYPSWQPKRIKWNM